MIRRKSMCNSYSLHGGSVHPQPKQNQPPQPTTATNHRMQRPRLSISQPISRTSGLTASSTATISGETPFYSLSTGFCPFHQQATSRVSSESDLECDPVLLKQGELGVSVRLLQQLGVPLQPVQQNRLSPATGFNGIRAGDSAAAAALASLEDTAPGICCPTVGVRAGSGSSSHGSISDQRYGENGPFDAGSSLPMSAAVATLDVLPCCLKYVNLIN